jgi:hypothetical protein
MTMSDFDAGVAGDPPEALVELQPVTAAALATAIQIPPAMVRIRALVLMRLFSFRDREGRDLDGGRSA